MDVRQVVVSEPHRVELAQRHIDDTPPAQHVLVETEASFISAGTELANYTALDPTANRPGAWNAYPWPAGYANCGRIIAVGDGVETFAAGQRVFSFGKHVSHHHQSVEPRESGFLVVAPESLGPDLVAACRLGLVALTAVQTSEVQLNDWVAVLGLGVVGNLACQLFRLSGARVIGVDPMAARRQLAAQVGVDHVVGGDGDSVGEAIRELAGVDGARIVVDAVGDARVVEQAAGLAMPFGEVILLGSPRAPYQAEFDALVRPMHYRWVMFKGALEWRIPRYPARGVRHSTYGNALTVFDLVQSGRLNVADLISHRLPPDQIEQAYQGLLHDQENFWGVVLDWRSADSQTGG